MSRQDDLQRLIVNCQRRLQKLQEQRAKFGELHTPPYILIEIEDTEAELESLQAELAEIVETTLPEKMAPVPVSPSAVQVFISYSRQDLGFTQRLAADLERNGFATWWDVSNLEPGDIWAKSIEAALQESQYCIVVLSPTSVSSPWVLREVMYAEKLQLTIIPLLYESCEKPLNLIHLQHIDFRGNKYRRSLQELLPLLASDNRPPPPIRTEPRLIRITISVEVRAGPGEGFETTVELQPNKKAKVLGKSADGEWLYIRAAGWRGPRFGWMRNDPILYSPATAPPRWPWWAIGAIVAVIVVFGGWWNYGPIKPSPIAILTSTPPQKIVIVFEVSAILKASPDRESATVKELQPNQTVEVLGKTADGAWLQIAVIGAGPGSVGWVRNSPETFNLSNNLENIPTVPLTPTLTKTPTDTPIPTPTGTPTDIPTATPPPTGTPTDTPTPTATPPPNQYPDPHSHRYPNPDQTIRSPQTNLSG